MDRETVQISEKCCNTVVENAWDKNWRKGGRMAISWRNPEKAPIPNLSLIILPPSEKMKDLEELKGDENNMRETSKFRHLTNWLQKGMTKDYTWK